MTCKFSMLTFTCSCPPLKMIWYLCPSLCIVLFLRGMDPMIFCGLLGVASAGVRFAAGSAMFKSVWRVWNKEMAQNLQEVQKHTKNMSSSDPTLLLPPFSIITVHLQPSSDRGRLDGYVIIICSLLGV